MKVAIDKIELEQMSQGRFRDYLQEQGLDTTKEIIRYECPRDCSVIFVGTTLADKVVGFIDTVIGKVPITQPYESIGV